MAGAAPVTKGKEIPQMNFDEVPNRVPLIAAKKAAATLPPLSTADLDDMEQEARICAWKLAERANGPGYLVNAGRNAALLWWRKQIAQVKDYHDAKEFGGFSDLAELDAPVGDGSDTLGDILPAPEPEPAAEPSPLFTSERINTIINWLIAYNPAFFATPRGRKKRGLAINILQLLAEGYNTRGCAQELGVSEGTISAYRREIRKALEAKTARQSHH
jgi:DNA-directed RNA polymerase specialized sigma24 family protein